VAPLTCELWQDWCSVTFSDLWSQQGEDPWGTPATVSLSDLQELSKNLLSNHVLWSHRKPRWVIASCRSCTQSFDFRPKISLYSVQKAFQQRKHKYCEKKVVDTEREEQNKKTYNCFDLWVPPLCLSSARWDELQCIVKVVDTYDANAGARELHPAHNHCTRSTDDEEDRSQKPWRLLFPHNQYMRRRSEVDSNANPLSSIRSRSKSHLSPTTTTCAFLSRSVAGWKSFWGFVLSQLP
jgi:hypothetical protein